MFEILDSRLQEALFNHAFPALPEPACPVNGRCSGAAVEPPLTVSLCRCGSGGDWGATWTGGSADGAATYSRPGGDGSALSRFIENAALAQNGETGDGATGLRRDIRYPDHRLGRYGQIVPDSYVWIYYACDTG